MNVADHAGALRGCKLRNGGTARCPARDDRDRSFSIPDADNDKVLVCCNAGHDQLRITTAPLGPAPAAKTTWRADVKARRYRKVPSAAPAPQHGASMTLHSSELTNARGIDTRTGRSAGNMPRLLTPAVAERIAEAGRSETKSVSEGTS